MTATDTRTPVLVIDDDPSLREALTVLLEDDFRVATVATGAEGLALLAQEVIPLVLLDLRLPGMPGLEVLQHIKAQAPNTAVMILSALQDVTTVVDAMQYGATDFLPKPYDNDDLRNRLHLALTTASQQGNQLRQPPRWRWQPQVMLGHSAVMQRLHAQIRQVADTTATVLIRGESGVGKELVARALHQQSSRRRRPFVSLNCAAIASGLIASELFGHERGALTGAVQSRRGVFERADTGTLFLDEVCSLSLIAQAHLLRTLQDGLIVRVGGETQRQVEVRVVAATNQDLGHLVATHALRADLFHRLNVVPLDVPALRERREDIPLLVTHFLHQYTTMHHRQVEGVSAAALEILCQYAWPGNVRELANVLERLVVLSTQRLLDAKAVQAALE